MRGGPFAHLDGLSDDEEGSTGGSLNEASQWGEATLQKMVADGQYSGIGDEFDEEEKEKKREHRKRWLFAQESSPLPAKLSSGGRARQGTMLMDVGDAPTRLAAKHEAFLRTGVGHGRDRRRQKEREREGRNRQRQKEREREERKQLRR